jgi:DNA-directed RNA polymerase specialized sigma24 family protein
MKKGRFINWQRTRVIETKSNSSEGSPYWKWLEKRAHIEGDSTNGGGAIELREPARANPDILAAEDEDLSTLTRDIMVEVIKEVKLSKNERLTLQAFSYPDATEENVAAKLGCTRRTVRTYLHRAQKKCEKLFVAKMRESGV